MRLSAVLLALPALACAQIQDLATTDDGAQTYFSTAYRQKGTAQPSYLKIFRIAENGLQLFRRLEYFQNYYAGGDMNFYLAERPSVSGDGRVVAFNASRTCLGVGSYCIAFQYDEAFLAGPSFDQSLGAARVVVSPDAQSYMLYAGGPTAVILIADTATGKSTTPTGCVPIGDGRQSLANRAVALLTCTSPVLWKAGQTTPLALQSPLKNARMDAGADMIVYQSGSGLHSYSVPSGADLLLASGPADFHPWITRDGTQVSYILNDRLYVQSTSGGLARALTDPSDGVIVDAIISGWGNVAFAANSYGRLLRIDVATGDKKELIAPVPHLQVRFAQTAPGGRVDVTVTGPPDGDPVVTGAGATAPIVSRADNVVTFQIPWEVANDVSSVSLVVPGNRSAFEEVHDLEMLFGKPDFYSVAVHQDFSAVLSESSPAQPGEIVHVYATDLGIVYPPIATGAITPTGTLYRLDRPFQCDFYQDGKTLDAYVLFVGLAPETIGVNQLDVMIPMQATGPTIELNCQLGYGFGVTAGSTQLPVASR